MCAGDVLSDVAAADAHWRDVLKGQPVIMIEGQHVVDLLATVVAGEIPLPAHFDEIDSDSGALHTACPAIVALLNFEHASGDRHGQHRPVASEILV